MSGCAGVAWVVSGATTLHMAGAASRSAFPDTGVLAPELMVGSLNSRRVPAAPMFGSCGRAAQYVPGTPPSLSSDGSRVMAAESRKDGVVVCPSADQTMARGQARLTREKPGANASAPAALSTTAMTVIATARRSINGPRIRIRILSASQAPRTAGPASGRPLRTPIYGNRVPANRLRFSHQRERSTSILAWRGEMAVVRGHEHDDGGLAAGRKSTEIRDRGILTDRYGRRAVTRV
jgi:hypothetical protein